jgi:hypothetical protein
MLGTQTLREGECPPSFKLAYAYIRAIAPKQHGVLVNFFFVVFFLVAFFLVAFFLIAIRFAMLSPPFFHPRTLLSGSMV